MRRGQISFDFVFAAIAAIVVLQFLIGIGLDLGESRENAAIAGQARRIASGIEMAENYSRIYDDLGSGSEVAYEIPLMRGGEGMLGCTISLEADRITITPEGWGEAIAVNANIKKLGATSCGSTITFTGSGAS